MYYTLCVKENRRIHDAHSCLMHSANNVNSAQRFVQPVDTQKYPLTPKHGFPRQFVTDKTTLLGEKITYKDRELTYGCASMGNPHMAVLVENVDSFPIEEVGPYFEKHPMFPNKCNISFAEVISHDSIAMDTCERGVGRTLACGTGTCATVAVLHRMGLVGNKVHACLSGGDLVIELDGSAVFMTGPAKVVFRGTYEMQVPNEEEALFAALRGL